MVRATVQRMSVCQQTYDQQTYASMMFGQAGRPVELPNIKEVKWSRTTDSAATMTMVLYNTDPLPLATLPTSSDLDVPGAYTYQHGTAFYSPRWNHAATGWQDWLVPDRVVRTYEGYGFNASVVPESDANLYLSGTWLIDDVELDHQGFITVTCRDLSRALLDQICMPPIVPQLNYPLFFEPPRTVTTAPTSVITIPDLWFQPCWDNDSNQTLGGAGVPVLGHVGYDAIDYSDDTYWLSYGLDSPNAGYSYEWLGLKFKARTLGAIRMRFWGGPYRVYISVQTTDGRWQGSQTVPYVRSDRNEYNGSDIPFLEFIDVPAEGLLTHKLAAPIDNAQKMRLTMTNLTPVGAGNYRCGVRNVRVAPAVTTIVPGTSHIEPVDSPPRYDDFTDIVKHLLAWSGFFWPQGSVAANVRTDGTSVLQPAPSRDPVLRSGRVWGDLAQTGTRGVAPLGVAFFDKKPIQDCISAIRDMVGFIFFVDEGGGAVFRPPNIWSIGNWVGDVAASAARTSSVITIDESKTLLSLGARLSSRSIRERVFVGRADGAIGAVSAGRNPYPSGLRRIGGWTDVRFTTVQECQIMADLITLRQLFTYRTDKVQIPGNPAIQVDDQVRIYERVTEEGYLHYVTDVAMSWSLETGKYTYELGTHWLGETPFSNWTFDPASLAAETRLYLTALKVIV